jgi:phospholipid/cholesterol/gamma-HCH transport system substrate-binding protein
MSRQARVGLLVLAGILLFLVVLFAIANRSFLFSDTFKVKAHFESVASLQTGAAVQYQGYNVGRVESIALPQEQGGQLTVTMALKQDVKHLINSSTVANIKSAGLVGNMIVVLVTPKDQLAAAEEIQSGDFINSQEPFNLYEVTDRALAAVDTFATVAVEAQQIMKDIQRGEGTAGKLLYDPELYNRFVATTEEAQNTLNDISRDADQMVTAAENVTDGIDAVLQKANSGEGTVGRFLNDPAVYNTFLATADTLQNIAGDLRSVTQSAENATNWAALGAYRFSENMEALKHNFLFKRYFEERGYYEKAPFEVREQAIEESYQQLQEERRRIQELRRRLEELVQEAEQRQRQVEADASAAAPSGETSEAQSQEETSSSPDGQN